MQSDSIFDSMDERTFLWLQDCILTAPDTNSLEGIRITIEWFYELDKDFDSFEKLINQITQQQEKLKTNLTDLELVNN